MKFQAAEELPFSKDRMLRKVERSTQILKGSLTNQDLSELSLLKAPEV